MGSKHLLSRAAAVATSAVLMPAAAHAAPPPNDAFEHPAAVDGIPAVLTGELAEATGQPGEPRFRDAALHRSLWYAYTPRRDQRIAPWLLSGQAPADVRIYTGAALGALEPVWTMPDGGRQPLELKAGTTYRIAVAGSDTTTRGAFELDLDPAGVPVNDTFAAARRAHLGVQRGFLADATAELGEPAHAGRAARHSVWYRFRAPRDGRMTIDTALSTCDTRLAAYAGEDLASLRPVASNRYTKDPTASGSTIRFQAHRGTTYSIAVDCEDPGRGAYVLGVSDQGIVGKGVELDVGAGQTLSGVIRRGLSLVVRTRRAVDLDIDLVVSRRGAHRLGLDSRVLGHAAGKLGYLESLPAAIPLRAAAKRALHGEVAVEADVRLTLRNSTARKRVLTVPVELAD